MDSISSALYQAVYKAVFQNFRSFYKDGYITAFDKSTDAGGGFYTYLAILRKKDWKEIKETDGICCNVIPRI